MNSKALSKEVWLNLSIAWNMFRRFRFANCWYIFSFEYANKFWNFVLLSYFKEFDRFIFLCTIIYREMFLAFREEFVLFYPVSYYTSTWNWFFFAIFNVTTKLLIHSSHLLQVSRARIFQYRCILFKPCTFTKWGQTWPTLNVF